MINSIKNAAQKVAQRSALAVGSVASMGLMTVAHAQETSVGVAAIEALGTQATSYTAAAFTVAVAVTGAFIGIKLFKKAANKAT